jgi:cation-transporting ATPase E
MLLGCVAASASFRNHTADAIRDAFPQPARQLKDEVAFDSSRKWSGIVFGEEDLKGAYVLGAPDVLAPHVKDAGGFDLKAEEWTQRGFRVLLLTVAEGAGRFERADGAPRLPAALKPLGLVVLRDETRPDAADVVREFAETGIDLKVISGDHPETVAALASQAGLPFLGEPASGLDLDSLDDAALAQRVDQAAIFGRISPHTKERIVSALKRAGHYVAMIGDGVNDVPALKSAHVAIALRSGAGITRDIADMVLLDDAFSSLPRAFREGQRIRKGMESIFRVFLTRTVSLTLVILAVSLLDDPFPVTPRHTALIAILTVGIPSLFLAVWAKPGRTLRLVILSGVEFILPAAIGIAVVGLIVYEFFLSSTGDVELARSALTFTAVGCGLLVILFLEPPTPFWAAANPVGGDWRPALLAIGMAVLLAITIATPVLRKFYEVEVPSVWGCAMIGAVIVAWAVTVRAFWRLDPEHLLRRLLRRGDEAAPKM